MPLHGGSHAADAENWDEENAAWQSGWRPEYCGNDESSYEEWAGERPRAEDYMPDWPDSERTHWQMYETCTEGTPISPVMATPEDLARWLADTGASAFGDMTASYEAWLATCRSGYAPSAVLSGGVLKSGVAAALDRD